MSAFKQLQEINSQIQRLQETKRNIMQSLFDRDASSILSAKEYGCGTVQRTVQEGDVKYRVKYARPKKVKWDSKSLHNVYQRFKDANLKPEDYMQLDFKIPEAKFSVLDNALKEDVRKYRTVEQGSVSVTLEVLDAD